ncbi:hypothetical protein SO802_007906 [Lithocarpus litseifolius]|uniref:Uncharacterized protein n=1 Tax=Lithocarpus litseifolius TaxID=425828 RepID=A0AAW2DQA0_9ROSI
MNPKKDSTPNLSPSTKGLDKPYNNNSPKIEDAMAPYCPINHGRGQSPRTGPPLSTLLSLMNEYKYFEEMLLTDTVSSAMEKETQMDDNLVASETHQLVPLNYFDLNELPQEVGDGDQQNLEGHKRILSFPERLRSMFSFPKTISTSYWEKVKTLINQSHAYFFPPNIEGGDEAEANVAAGGAGVKVKEAVTQSLGKSKATVEDSAKTAAKIVGETVKNTKEKVKNSLLEREEESQSEL